MRDIILLGLFCVVMLMALRSPFYAVVGYYWISIMSLHKLTWGFAYNLPWAEIAALVTFLSVIVHFKQLQIPKARETLLFILLWGIVTLSTAGSLYPQIAWLEWQSVSKIFLMAFITMMVITTRKQLIHFSIMIILFVGFFAVKGAIFAILTAGQYRVWGPPGSFLQDNNYIGLAFVMIIPLCFFIRKIAEKKWISYALLVTGSAAIIATALTYSRGALLGLVAIGFMYFLRSKNKVIIALVGIAVISVGLSLLPGKWYDRMNTIKDYEEDTSANQRINSWIFSYNIAKAYLLGGGFGCFTQEQYLLYSPDPELGMHYRSDGTIEGLTSHSIYFEVMAQQGFLGLIIYLAILVSVFFSFRKLDRVSRKTPDAEWIAHLSRGLFVSLIGFMVCGAFISRAYFELLWVLFAIIVSFKTIVLKGDWQIENMLEQNLTYNNAEYLRLNLNTQ